MALTLECFCGDNPGAATCVLTKLTLNLVATYAQMGLVEHLPSWNLFIDSPGGASILKTGSLALGNFAIDLDVATWVAGWGSIKMTVTGDQSLFQSPKDAGALFNVAYNIQQDYTCVNTDTGETSTFSLYAGPASSDDRTCILGGEQRSECHGSGSCTDTIGGGIGSVWVQKTTPLGACNGCQTTIGGFCPAPLLDFLDMDGSTDLCVCASGGTAPYHYYIAAGRLGSGLSLDFDTGCFIGSYDGLTPGTREITFGVIDANGDSATVDCNLHNENCPANENVFGNSTYV